MIRFEVNGEYLELPADFSLQFKKTNILFAFDDIKCERSTSFNIPATPQNDRIFALAKWAQNEGEGMRRRYEAQMQAGLVTKDGYLYVDAFENGIYKAVFVTGQLFGLLKIKDLGKIKDILTVSDVCNWSYGVVPDLPSRATNAFDIVKYTQYGEFTHPSWLVKYVIDQLVAQHGLPTITLPASAQKLRVILARPQLLQVTETEFRRTVTSGNWADITQTYPYPIITANELVTDKPLGSLVSYLVYYSAEYQRHWEDYDFQTMQPVLRTVTYGGRVAHVQIAQRIKITFPDNFPADEYIVSFDDSTYTGGITFLSDRTFTKQWNGSECVTTRYGDPLAGRTIDLEANKAFTFIKESDLLDETQYTGDMSTHETWERGWKNTRSALTISGLKIEGDGDAVVGEKVRLQDNLPDISIVELLKAIAVVSGKVLNYSDEDGITFDELEYENWATRSLDTVIKQTTLARKFGNYAQENLLLFSSDETVPQATRIISAYEIDNDNIEATKELLKIPFSEGRESNGVELAQENEKDTLANADATPKMIRCELPLNAGMQGLCEASTSVAVQVFMRLIEFDTINSKTTFYYNGVRYVWTEANWTKNVATIKMSKIPA